MTRRHARWQQDLSLARLLCIWRCIMQGINERPWAAWPLLAATISCCCPGLRNECGDIGGAAGIVKDKEPAYHMPQGDAASKCNQLL